MHVWYADGVFDQPGEIPALCGTAEFEYMQMISCGRIGPCEMTMSLREIVSAPFVHPHELAVDDVPTGESWSGSHVRANCSPVIGTFAVIVVVTFT